MSNSSLLEHPFAQYVRILGKGKTGSRSLSFEEASDAMGMILRGEVEDLQLGAFLMLLRVKEESPTEIAGFVKAVREQLPDNAKQSISKLIDWPSYAGKRSQLPWFILSALLLSKAGYPIFMHGSQGHTHGRLYTESVLNELGMNVASDWSDVTPMLERDNFCFLPLATINSRLQNIINLRNTLGLRSPVHTLVRLINPCGARYCLQSIFHPAYSHIHQQAAALLGNMHSMVFKGESGEIERKPDAQTKALLQHDGVPSEQTWPRLQDQRQANAEELDIRYLIKVWRGEADDEYALSAIIGTAAMVIALVDSIESVESAQQIAHKLWQTRDREVLQQPTGSP